MEPEISDKFPETTQQVNLNIDIFPYRWNR